MAHVVSGATEVTKSWDCLHPRPTTCCESKHRLFDLTLPSGAAMNLQHMPLPVCTLPVGSSKTMVTSQILPQVCSRYASPLPPDNPVKTLHIRC